MSIKIRQAARVVKFGNLDLQLHTSNWAIVILANPYIYRKCFCRNSISPGAASYYRGTGKYPGIFQYSGFMMSHYRGIDKYPGIFHQIPGYLTACQIPGYMTANDSENNVQFVQVYLRCVKLYLLQFRQRLLTRPPGL